MKRDHHPARRALALLLCVAQLSSLLPRAAFAQQIADPSAPGAQQATVLRAPNGVPLVHITTPSAAGVSRNQWRQFDVGADGVVLNNSRGDVATQLGGWVTGNPWLAAGSAKLILNEVNSTQASRLRGFVEVGGPRAEVVIANPAGIVVDGGGFINASRATLSTGQPLLSGGALQGFAVQQGLVRVQGAGLDAGSAEHAQILARAVEVNAGLWAQRLDVVAGANTVSADGADVTPAAPMAGDTPAFALDVSAIGGMYAGKIRLVGTEAGLGVRQAGLIDARGALTLDVNGWLDSEGGARSFAQTVAIQAGGVRNTQGAVIAARDALTITAGQIHNTEGALLLSVGDMRLQATERLENRSATIESLGDLDITTPALINANDAFETELVAQPGEPYLRLRHQGVDYTRAQIGANFGALNAYHDAAHWRVLLPSEAYPFELFPALASDWGLGGLASSVLWSGFTLPPTRAQPTVCGECIGDAEVEPYGPTHMVWQRFGVASPGAPPPYSGPMCQEDVSNCNAAQWQAYEGWRAQVNQHQQTREARYRQLDERIAAYNQDVQSRTLRDWTVIDATQVRHEPRVLRSAPGQIAAAGDIQISAAEVHNDKSHLLAGGALQVQGTDIVNTDADVSARTDISGQSVYSYFRDGCWWACNDDRLYTYAPYSASTERSVSLSVARAEANAAGAPTTTAQLPGGLNNALFAPAASPTAAYLIETDPRFANQRQWLSSAWLLDALSVEPASVHKRLGDGFVEQRLIREQVARLSGQRFLGDFSDDQAQYLALLNAGATFAQAHALRVGIALSPEQVAALTSDIVWLVAEDVTLPDGRTDRALVPRLYLAPRAGDLSPDGSLIAAREVQLQLDGALINGGRIAGRSLVAVEAGTIEHGGRIASEGGSVLRSRGDINVQGGEIAARDALVLAAGGDITVASTARSTSTKAQDSTHERTTLDRQARLHVSGEAGVLIAQAGRDLTLQAASVRNDGNDTALIAGRDLRLGTVSTRELDDIHWSADHRQRTQRSAELGTSIQTGGALTLQAGQHLQARAATLQAKGDLTLQAGGAIVLEAGRETLSVDEHHRVKHRGDFARKTVTEDLTLQRDSAVGSVLGGQTATLSAGQDITVKGSSVIGDQGVTIAAGRDIGIDADQHHHRQRHFRDVRESGLFTSGAGITLGKKQQSTDQRGQQTLAAASTVGAIAGDVNITAGARYRQSGADVLAPGGDVNITAADIAIAEARQTQHSRSEQRFKQSGLSVGASAPLLTAAQGALQTASALGKTRDARTQALGAATLALQGKQLLDSASALSGATSAASAADPAQAAGVSVSISLGSSQSRSLTDARSEGSRQSAVTAQGDVNLTARGAGQDSNLLVQGCDIHAGHAARLTAEGDITLQAARHQAEEHSRNDSRSASIGIGFSLGSGGGGLGVTASASRGKGAGDGAETTHRNAHVNAGALIVLDSGKDTTLEGAVASAERIEATAGGDLHIHSVQDTATYTEQQHNAGASVVVGAGAGGSLSAGKTKVRSTYASVAEQSALRAGDGGFDVRVQGKTALTGGAITSTQAAVDEDRNRFDNAGGLELSDVHNSAAYEASGVSVGIGTGSQLGASGAGIGSDKGSVSSTTHAGISGIAGNKDARTGDAESGIAPIFDKERVKREVDAQIEITGAFGKSATTAWGAHANNQFNEAVAEGDEESARCWAPDGACRAAGHALIGGLSGGAGGALGAATSSRTAPAFQAALIDAGIPADIVDGLTVAYAAGMGALGGGAAGSAGAINEAVHNSAQAARIILGTIEAAGPSTAQRCLQSASCVGAVGSAGVLMLNAIVASTNGDAADGTSLGNVNPHVFGGAESGLPADTYGTPPGGGGQPPEDEGKNKSEVRFDYSGVETHSGKRLRAEGITTKEAELAVRSDIDRRIADGSFRVSSTRSISYEAQVNGKVIEYRLIQRPGGTIRIGTIFVK